MIAIFPSASKIGMNVALQTFGEIWLEDYALVSRIKQIPHNLLDCSFVGQLGVIVKSCALMSRHCYVWATSSLQVAKHANEPTVLPARLSSWTIHILVQ